VIWNIFLQSTDSPDGFQKSSCCVGRGHKRQDWPRAVHTIGQGQPRRNHYYVDMTALFVSNEFIYIIALVCTRDMQILCCTGPCINITILWDMMPCILIHGYQHFCKDCCLHLQDRKVSRKRKELVQLWGSEARKVLGFAQRLSFHSVYTCTNFNLRVSLFNPEDGGSRFLRLFVTCTKLHGVIKRNIIFVKCWKFSFHC
jgi:hypothetical protein